MSTQGKAAGTNFVLAVELQRLDELSAFIGQLNQLQSLVKNQLNGEIDLDLTISSKTFKAIGDSVRKSMRQAYQAEFIKLEEGLTDLTVRQSRIRDAGTSGPRSGRPVGTDTPTSTIPRATSSPRNERQDIELSQLVELRAIKTLLSSWSTGAKRKTPAAAQGQPTLPSLLEETGTTRLPATTAVKRRVKKGVSAVDEVAKTFEEIAREQATSMEKVEQSARRAKLDLDAARRKLELAARQTEDYVNAPQRASGERAFRPANNKASRSSQAATMRDHFTRALNALDEGAKASSDPQIMQLLASARNRAPEAQKMWDGIARASAARRRGDEEAAIKAVEAAGGRAIDAKGSRSVSAGIDNLMTMLGNEVRQITSHAQQAATAIVPHVGNASAHSVAVRRELANMRAQGQAIANEANRAGTAEVAAGARSMVVNESRSMAARMAFASGSSRETRDFPQGSVPVGGAKKTSQDFEQAIKELLTPIAHLVPEGQTTTRQDEVDRVRRALGARENVLSPRYTAGQSPVGPLMSSELRQLVAPELATVLHTYGKRIADQLEEYYKMLPQEDGGESAAAAAGLRRVEAARFNMAQGYKAHQQLDFLDDPNLTQAERLARARQLTKGKAEGQLPDAELMTALEQNRTANLAALEDNALKLMGTGDKIMSRLVSAQGEADRKRIRADVNVRGAAAEVLEGEQRNRVYSSGGGAGPGSSMATLGGFGDIVRVNVENADELATAYAIKMARVGNSEGRYERTRNPDGTVQPLYDHPNVRGGLAMRRRHLEGQADFFGDSVAPRGMAPDISWELSPARVNSVEEAAGYAKLLDANNLQFVPHTAERQKELLSQHNYLRGKRAAALTEFDQLRYDKELEEKASQIMQLGEYVPKGAGLERGVFNGMALSTRETKALAPSPIDFDKKFSDLFADMHRVLTGAGVSDEVASRFMTKGPLPDEFRQSGVFKDAMDKVKGMPGALDALTALSSRRTELVEHARAAQAGEVPDYTRDQAAVAKLRQGTHILNDGDMIRKLGEVEMSSLQGQKVLGSITEQSEKLGKSFSALNQLSLTPFLRQLEMLAAVVDRVKPAFDLATSMIRVMSTDSAVGKQMRKVMGTAGSGATATMTPDELKRLREGAEFDQTNYQTFPVPARPAPGKRAGIGGLVDQEAAIQARQEAEKKRAGLAAGAVDSQAAYVRQLALANPEAATRLNDLLNKNLEAFRAKGQMTDFTGYDAILAEKRATANRALQKDALADDRRRSTDLALTGAQNAADALAMGRGQAAALLAGGGGQIVAGPTPFTNLTEAFDTLLPARSKLKSSYEAWQSAANKSVSARNAIIAAGGDPESSKPLAALRQTEQRQLLATVAALETFERVLLAAGQDAREDFGLAFGPLLKDPLLGTLGKVRETAGRGATLRQSMADYTTSEAELKAIRERAVGSQKLTTGQEQRIDQLVTRMNTAAESIARELGQDTASIARRKVGAAVNYLPETDARAGKPMVSGATPRVIGVERDVLAPDMKAAALAADTMDKTTLGIARNLMAGTQGLKQMKSQLDSTSNAWGKFKNKVENLLMYMGAGGILYTASAAIQRGFREAMQFETDIADLKGITMGESPAFQRRLRPGIEELAQQYGVGRSDVTRQVKTFAQAGFGERSLEFSRAALTATKGLGIEANQASEMLVANENVTNGRISPEQILDKISRVERTRAVSAQDLSVAIQRAGSIVEQLQPEMLGGVDPQDFLIGAVTEIVQKTRVSGNQAATSLRFMLSRLAAPDVAKSLQGDFGIKLGEGSPDTLRPASDILGDIAAKYKDLMANNKSNDAFQLLTSFAGARQVNAAAALFGDWDKVMATAVDASRAFGDAQLRLALQMDTLATKTTQLQDTFFSFVTKLMEDTPIGDAAKGVVGGVNSALKFGTKNPTLGMLGLLLGGPLLLRGAGMAGRGVMSAVSGSNTLRAAAARSVTISAVDGAAMAARGGPKSLLGAAPAVGAAAESVSALSVAVPMLVKAAKWLAPRVAGGYVGIGLGTATLAAGAYSALRGDGQDSLKPLGGITPEMRAAYGKSQEAVDFNRSAERFGKASPEALSDGVSAAMQQAFADVRKDPKFAAQANLFLDPNKKPDLKALQASGNTGLFRALQERVALRFSENLGADFAMIGGPVATGDKNGQRQKIRAQYQEAMRLMMSADRFENQGYEAYIEQVRGRGKDAMPKLEDAQSVLSKPIRYGSELDQSLSGKVGNWLTRDATPAYSAKILDFDISKIPGKLSQALGPEFGAALMSTYFEDPAKSFANQLALAARSSDTLGEALAQVTKRMFTLDGAMQGALASMPGGFDGNIARKGLAEDIGKMIESLDPKAEGYATRRALLVEARTRAGNTNAAVEANMANLVGGGITGKSGTAPTNKMSEMLEAKAKQAERRGNMGAAAAIRDLSVIQTETYERLAEVAGGKELQNTIIRTMRDRANQLISPNTREGVNARIADRNRGRGGGGAFLNDVVLQPLMQFTQRNMDIRNTAPLSKRFGFGFDQIGERYQAAVQFLQSSAGIESALFGQEMLGRRQEFIGRMGGVMPGDLANTDVDMTADPTEEGRTQPGVAEGRRRSRTAGGLRRAQAAQTVATNVRQLIKDGKGESLQQILGAEGMKEVTRLLPQLAGKTISALVPMTETVSKFLALFDNDTVRANVESLNSAFRDYFNREAGLRAFDQETLNRQAGLELRGQQANAQSQLMGLSSQLGRDPLGDIRQALRDVAITAELQLQQSQLQEERALAREELADPNNENTKRKRSELVGSQAQQRANMERSVAASQQAIRDQYRMQLQLRMQNGRDALQTDSLGGLKQDLAQGFRGKALERTFASLGDTFVNRVSGSFVDQLLGPGGAFGDAFSKLFQSPALMEANLIREAHIAGISMGFSQVYGLTGLGAAGGASGATPLAALAAGGGAMMSVANLDSSMSQSPLGGMITVRGGKSLSVPAPASGAAAGSATALLQATLEANYGKPTDRWANLKEQGGILAGTIGGSLLGANTTGRGKANGGYSAMGANIGAMAGTLIPIPVLGPMIGGAVGGLLGGLLGKKKERKPPELSALERIERNTRETISALENQTRTISLDSRFLNAPSTFAVPSYSPMGVSPTQEFNVTIMVNGAGNPAAVAQSVAAEVKRLSTANGKFATTRA